ncbi:MAG TPA: glycerophosphodiester phosphodiesterase family protein [Steroidobacteraceae bacterium]|nr:glycerophosphodiester phosphodiesterase family protein [Steroidobacteraceae bacterium]
MPPTALPQIVAHRGNAAEFPENTLPALSSAVELGLKYLEFDVQLTADKVPVVVHDADLNRVADREGNVHEMTWSQLAETPVGEVKRFGRRFAFTYPPSLAQTVDAIAAWPGVTAFVEIKRASLRKFGRETVLRRVVEVLKPILDRCVLISFDLPSVRILRLMAGARVGWILTEYTEAAHQEAAAAAPDFLFCNLARLPEGTEALWPGPWSWAVYEVRDVTTARHCQALGADFVETMAVRGLLTAYEESRRQW